MLRKWLIMLLTIASPRLVDARYETVFRCVGDAGEVYFTDRACPDGQVLSFDPATVVTLSMLDDHARSRSRQLDHDLDVRIRARTHGRSATPAERSRDQAAQIRRCAAAEDAVERVRAKKRHGYRVAEAAALDAREAGYQKQRERECSGSAR